jgi:hypothetical protein
MYTTGDVLGEAAKWYIGAFGVVGSLLLAGTQLSGVDWSKASNPWLAITAMSCAVAAAAAVVFIATRVVHPGETLLRLQEREDRIARRIQRKNKAPTLDLEVIASKDWLLRRLVVESFLDVRPTTLASLVRRDEPDAAARADVIVAAANGWRAERNFRMLRFVTPLASAVVLAGALLWSIGTQPASNRPAVDSPVPVTIVLANEVDPASVVGPGCSARELTGVAIGGDLKARSLVAIPPQQDCPGAIVMIGSNDGVVTEAKTKGT